MVQVLPPQPVTNLFRTVCKVLPGKGVQPHKFRTSCWDNKENVDGVRVPRESPAVLGAAPPYGVSDHTVCGIQRAHAPSHCVPIDGQVDRWEIFARFRMIFVHLLCMQLSMCSADAILRFSFRKIFCRVGIERISAYSAASSAE